MESTNGATRHSNPPGGDTPSRTDRPQAGFTLARNGAFTVPSLSKIKSTHYFATQWHKLHPRIPLIPVRRQAPGPKGPKGGGTSPKSALWVPVEGWLNEPHTGPELARLLKANPTLGIGLRSGCLGLGMPWLVDILVRKGGNAGPALRRLLEHHDRAHTATWSDEEGTHLLFVGDDRLAGFGPIVVGEFQGNGGNPHYAGLEIRLGSADPATSLAVLPPTPLDNGKPRTRNGKPRTRRRGGDQFSSLPKRFYTDLGRFAGATNVGADGTRTAWAAPEANAPREPSGPRPKRSRKVVALRGPDDRQSVDTPVVEPPAKEVQETPSSCDLAGLAAMIQDEVRAGHLLMFKGLEHYRQAGKMLTEAKVHVGHGGFERFVEDHCGFSTETANVYKRVFLEWSKIEAMRLANPQSATDLTLAEVVKQLAKPRKTSGTGAVPATPEAIDQVAPEDLDQSPMGPFAALPSDLVGEPALTDHSSPRPGEDRGEGLTATVACLAVDDPSRSAGRGEAPATEVVEVDGDGAGASDPATVATAAGAAITEEHRRRVEDLSFLNGRAPIRALRQKLGDTRDFDADATLWRLLQLIAGEILARERLVGRKHGLIAPLIVDFLQARPPGEWDLCPTCDGACHLEPEGEHCARCEGRGYMIPL